MTKTISSVGEDALVAAIAGSCSRIAPRLIKGMGDDTSVTVQKSGMALLATTDSLIEGIHFVRAHTTPYLLGRRCLSVSLSDIAAMGGRPLFHLISIAMPPDTPKAFISGLYKGIDACGLEYGSCLAGGNTASLPDRLVISSTVFGEMDKRRVVYRSGARHGDVIYVSGRLGDSALGLKILQEDGPAALTGRYKDAVAKHLNPAPRLALGAELAKGRLASAMMDLSDGLGIDLGRLCEASGAAGRIELAKIPVSPQLTHYAKGGLLGAAAFAAGGGEDYELLFTSPVSRAKGIAAAARRSSTSITPIGIITERKRGRQTVTFLSEDGREVDLPVRGFQHF
ncbi:MAG: thiamine-phosphate kinase [Deltaproteobacteria bacterium RIFCSPLOWO2_02_FULL_53_8]|nr:MAG: thiamine-phosphate kinase [Deltaproteobacteria bacterium RIFCSPLOWO2_02_FULL_53_8]